MEGWAPLVVSLAVFFGIHLILPTRLRDRMVAAMGERSWKTVVTIVALAGLAGIIVGFRQAPGEPVVYSPPQWAQYVPIVAMMLAFITFVGAYTSSDMQRITRHPMLWGVVLWGAAHLTANGNARDLVLFGSFLVFSLVMQPLMDARDARKDPQGWAATKQATSAIPFAALLAKRAGPRAGDFTVKAVLHGLLAYVVVLILHGWVLGVAIAPNIPPM